MSPTHHVRPCLILLLLALFGCNEPPVDNESADAMASPEDVSTVESADYEGEDRADSEALTDSSLEADGSTTQTDAIQSSNDSSLELDQAFIPTQPCERTNDCPEPQVCNENLCDESTMCQRDEDCTLGYLCNRSRNRCVIACRTQANCPMDKICTCLLYTSPSPRD